jgi:gas vesicle protein
VVGLNQFDKLVRKVETGFAGRRETMKRIFHNRRKKSVGKVVTGMLIGSLLGVVVAWLTAPLSGEDLRRRIAGAGREGYRSIRDKVKTAEGNVESRARDLAAEVNENVGDGRETSARRRNASSY